MLLCTVGSQPEVFDSLVECLLVVQQVQLAGLLLQLSLVDGTFCLPLVEDGDAESQSQRVVPVPLDLFAETEVVAVGIRASDACAEA